MGTVVIHLILAECTVLITALAETHVTEAVVRCTRVTIASVETSEDLGADRPATAAEAQLVPNEKERVAQLLKAPIGTTAYDLFCAG